MISLDVQNHGFSNIVEIVLNRRYIIRDVPETRQAGIFNLRNIFRGLLSIFANYGIFRKMLNNHRCILSYKYSGLELPRPNSGDIPSTMYAFGDV